VLVLEQNLDDLSKIDSLTSVDRQDIWVDFCLLDNLVDIRTLLYQLDAFFTLCINQKKLIAQDLVAFWAVTNNWMVGVHLRPWKDLSYLLLWQLYVCVGIFNIHAIFVSNYVWKHWIVTVRCTFGSHTISELAFDSFWFNIDRLIGLVQKCLAVSKQPIAHRLLCDMTFIALNLGVKREFTTLTNCYSVRIKDRAATTLARHIHLRQHCWLPACYVSIKSQQHPLLLMAGRRCLLLAKLDITRGWSTKA